jgi:hypothetical protein
MSHEGVYMSHGGKRLSSRVRILPLSFRERTTVCNLLIPPLDGQSQARISRFPFVRPCFLPSLGRVLIPSDGRCFVRGQAVVRDGS